MIQQKLVTRHVIPFCGVSQEGFSFAKVLVNTGNPPLRPEKTAKPFRFHHFPVTASVPSRFVHFDIFLPIDGIILYFLTKIS